MKLRCELHVNGGMRKVVMVARPNEPGEHLAHKLAALVLFWDYDPIIDASVKTPALADYEFLPDLLSLDEGGEVRLWVECGSVTLHKLKKLTRRLPAARIVVMKETEREAARLRKDLEEQLARQEKVEIFAWPGTSFRDWAGTVGEKTEIFGEGNGHLINAVVNERPVVAEMRSF